MKNLFSKAHNKRTRFTRMCIGEAVFDLMNKKEYDKIKISDIVKRAGVSRMTFYHYYETKEDALTDFFHEIVAGYVRDRVKHPEENGEFQSDGSIVHALKYFDQYRGFIQKLVDAGLYQIVLNAMNDYMLKRVKPRYHISEYELYFYGGALLNVFMKWQENGKKESPEEIAKIIAPQFPENEESTIKTIVARYATQDTWKSDLIFQQDSFELLQDILETAGELSERAPYGDLVTTEFAEAAVR